MMSLRPYFVVLLLILNAFVMGSSPARAEDAEEPVAESAWTWENPFPQGNALNDIWTEGSNAFTAVGEGGALVRFDEGLTQAYAPGIRNEILAVWGVRKDSVYAVGTGGTILHFDGETWNLMESPVTDYDLTGVWGADDEDIFAVGRSSSQDKFQGVILRYDGTSWQEMFVDLEDFELSGVWGKSGDDVWAVGFHYGAQTLSGIILHYDGSEWRISSRATYPPLYDINGNIHGLAYAVGSDGAVLRLEESGWTVMNYTSSELDDLSWSELRTVSVAGDGSMAVVDVWQNRVLSCVADVCRWIEAPSDLRDIRAVSGTETLNLTVAGEEGKTYRFESESWVPLTYSRTRTTLNDVHGSDGENVYAVGEEGTILHYDGVTWFSMRSGVEEALNGVWASPWSAVFAAGEKGRVLIRLGDRWIPMATGTDADLNAVGGSIEIAEHGVYAVGDGGVVIHFDGSAWSRIPLEEEANLNDLWVTREGMVYVVGDGGLILRYRNSQWSYMESGTDQDLNVVVGRRPGLWSQVPVAAGKGGKVLFYDGISWVDISPGESLDFRAILSNYRDDIFVVSAEGVTYRYDGNSWTRGVAPIAEGILSGWGRPLGDSVIVGQSGAILRFSDQAPSAPAVKLYTDKESYSLSDTVVVSVAVENRGPAVFGSLYVYLRTPASIEDISYLSSAGWRDSSVPLFDPIFIPSGYSLQAELFTIQLPISFPRVNQPGTYRLGIGFFSREDRQPIGETSVTLFEVVE